MRWSEELFAGIPTVLLGQEGVDIGPAEAGCLSDGRYVGALSALVVEPGAGRFQGGLMDVKNPSHQTKCHLLIESATDETLAEAMLPPRRAVSDYELE